MKNVYMTQANRYLDHKTELFRTADAALNSAINDCKSEMTWELRQRKIAKLNSGRLVCCYDKNDLEVKIIVSKKEISNE